MQGMFGLPDAMAGPGSAACSPPEPTTVPRPFATPLRDLQHAIARCIVLGVNDAASTMICGDGFAAEQRLAIHRNTFTGSLTKALRLTYPAVDRLVGSAFFDGAAHVFVHELPPRSAWLDDYGADFPEFLAAFAPAASLPYLSDVARLEWAVSRALHAADAEPVDVARLAAIDEAEHGGIHFTPHPSVTLLQSNYPVDELWHAVIEQDNDALATLDLGKGPVRLLVQRSSDATGEVRVARIEEAAWRFAEQLFAGVALGIALESTASDDTPAWLAQHLAAGRFVAFSLADARGIAHSKENLR